MLVEVDEVRELGHASFPTEPFWKLSVPSCQLGRLILKRVVISSRTKTECGALRLHTDHQLDVGRAETELVVISPVASPPRHESDGFPQDTVALVVVLVLRQWQRYRP